MGFVAAGRVRLFLIASIAAIVVPAHAALDSAASARDRVDRIASLTVPFVETRASDDAAPAFVARTFIGPVTVTAEGKVVYALPLANGRTWRLEESFSPASLKPAGVDASPTVVSVFAGGRPAATGLAAFGRVRLGEVAPGISAELKASGRNVEKLLTVAAGANASRLVIRLQGATHLSLSSDGSLVAETPGGELAFTAPVAWQEGRFGREPVEVRYGLRGGDAYAFALGDHDPTRPVYIDPLVKSTYSGGGGTDVIRAMLVHPGSGDVYVAGSTSAGFTLPTGINPAIPYKPGGVDAFIARYSASLTSLKSITFYGGSADDVANAITIMPSSGHIYVAGTTTSNDLPNAGSKPGAGLDPDGFIVHFDGGLTNLIGARYFGGSAADNGMALAADDLAGEIVLAGDTLSGDLPLGGAGSPQSINNGGQDAFVARFAADLTLIRTTYFGGGQNDYARAVAIDPITGDVVIGGGTQSSTLPKVAGGAQTLYGGTTDGFLARYNRTLTTLQQSTYFGGTGTEDIAAIAVHPYSSHVYITGATTSSTLPGKPTGQLIKGTGTDAFVARVYPELTGVKAVTFFGDSGEDFGTDLAISTTTGEVYVGGYSSSTTLPGSGFGVQVSNAGPLGINDAFIVRMDAGLATTGAWQATFRGAGGNDIGRTIALSDQQAYVAGETASGNFPAVAGSAQSTPLGGASDGFIAMVPTDLRDPSSNPAAFSFAPVAGALPLSFQTSAPVRILSAVSAVAYVDGQPGSTWCASSAANCTCDLTGNGFTSNAITMPATPYYVCVRQIAPASPNAIGEATLHVGATAATFRVTTGLVPGFGCSLDVDGNGAMDALTDGLLVIRALFGLTGNTVTNGAVGANAARPTWADIQQYLNAKCGGSFAP